MQGGLPCSRPQSSCPMAHDAAAVRPAPAQITTCCRPVVGSAAHKAAAAAAAALHTALTNPAGRNSNRARRALRNPPLIAQKLQQPAAPKYAQLFSCALCEWEHAKTRQVIGRRSGRGVRVRVQGGLRCSRPPSSCLMTHDAAAVRRSSCGSHNLQAAAQWLALPLTALLRLPLYTQPSPILLVAIARAVRRPPQLMQ
jgi:hypothetical protein